MICALNVEILRGQTRIGGGQYAFQLIRRMAELMEDGQLMLVNNSYKGRKERKPELPVDESGHVVYKNVKISKKALRFAQGLTGLPRLEHLVGKFDIYHEPGLSPLPLTRAKKVITLHDIGPYTSKYVPEDYSRRLRPYYHQAVEWADAIIVDAEFTRAEILNTFSIDESKISIIPLAGNEHFRRIDDPEAVAAARQSVGVGENFFLFVGTLEPRKNVANIIRAYNIFRERVKSKIELVLCGQKGWLSDEIFSEHENSPFKDDIKIPGYTPEETLIRLMNGCLAFVFPSLFEGFGIPLLEAMACGAPAISSTCTSLPEVAGDAAILVDPQSPEALADAMASVAEKPELRKELIEKGFARCAEFTWQKTARQTVDLYRRLLDS